MTELFQHHPKQNANRPQMITNSASGWRPRVMTLSRAIRLNRSPQSGGAVSVEVSSAEEEEEEGEAVIEGLLLLR